MKRKYPRYCRSFVDCHGGTRYYFHRAGGKNIPLPGLPWSPTFMAAYEIALNGSVAVKAKPGSVDAVVLEYLISPGFASGLADNTRKTRRAILTRFAKEYGHLPIAQMDGVGLQKILSKMTPAVQRGFKKAMRGFIAHCLSHRLMRYDPFLGVKLGFASEYRRLLLLRLGGNALGRCGMVGVVAALLLSRHGGVLSPNSMTRVLQNVLQRKHPKN
jgi:hypothetical protein